MAKKVEEKRWTRIVRSDGAGRGVGGTIESAESLSKGSPGQSRLVANLNVASLGIRSCGRVVPEIAALGPGNLIPQPPYGYEKAADEVGRRSRESRPPFS